MEKRNKIYLLVATFMLIAWVAAMALVYADVTAEMVRLKPTNTLPVRSAPVGRGTINPQLTVLPQ